MNITPASRLKRNQEFSLEQMKENQQTGTISTHLPVGGELTVLFEWVGDSVGANMAYSWEFKEVDKSDDEVIEILTKGEADSIGTFINIWND